MARKSGWVWKAVVWVTILGALLVVATELLDPAFRYRSSVRRYAVEYGLDPRLVTAMISAESSGRTFSRSKKGAMGLMQLMPATAAEVARSFGVTRVTDDLLHDPDFNIHLGTAYMAQLMKRFSSLELALAAYNAGPSRVDEWIAKNPGLSPPEIVECAAFEETRNYVHRVLDRMDAG
ncbi:MAG: lytic transglycosylase domain-containing protein [Planctomycetes bacterium]|nr:lytic transglycosylase domain-containing protein [Planctomycetota bacterium]MBI3847290.1 lytic transglycosylase domain-containing protein [Planctomycetota bacterium]